jgi:hypothetical protein
MSDNRKKCFRCSGQKFVYRIGKNGYSLMDMGGEKLDCPSCKATGWIDIPDYVEDAKETLVKVEIKKRKRKKKELIQDDGFQEAAREEAKEENGQELHA